MASHKNAVLTPQGRWRLVARVKGLPERSGKKAGPPRPIAHIAAEGGVSRQVLTKWVRRYELFGKPGLEDRSSRPARSETQTKPEVEDRIEELRRQHGFGPDRIQGELKKEGIFIAVSTVWRVLGRLGIAHRDDLDMPTGNSKRKPQRVEIRTPGKLLHMDVKKVGKIPLGGGWRIHGRGTEKAKQSKRVGNTRPGYTYLHVCIDACTRLVYVEPHENERAVTVIAFLDRAMTFFASHGINEIQAVMTDNGSAYKSKAFKNAMADWGVYHRRIPPGMPALNGKVERFNRTMQDEYLYAQEFFSEEARRHGLAGFMNLYNHDRPHSRLNNEPPVSRAPLIGPRLREIDTRTLAVPTTEEIRGQLTLDLIA